MGGGEREREKVFSSYAINKLIVYGEGSTKMAPSFFMVCVLQNVEKKSKMLRAQVETSVDWFLTLTLFQS